MFRVIARVREDGNGDVVAAIQISQLQDELNYSPNYMEVIANAYLHKCAPNENFIVVDVEVVTDVIDKSLL